MNPTTVMPTAGEIRQLLARESGLPPRLAYTALLLAGLGGAVVLGSLLATEPALPDRTRIAFVVMTAMALAWAGLAAWVLARRRVLLAGHRVIAAGMAVGFSGLFTAGAAALALRGAPAGWPAAGLGSLMLLAALGLWSRARRRRRALETRRRELERQLAGVRA